MEMDKDTAIEPVRDLGGKGPILHFPPESHQHCKDQEFLEDLNSGERPTVQAVGGVVWEQSRFLPLQTYKPEVGKIKQN